MSRLQWIAEEDFPRVDRFLAAKLPDISRSKLAQLCQAGNVLVEGKLSRSSKAVCAGNTVVLELPEEGLSPLPDPRARRLPLDIVFENENFLILNKERGRVVHPAPGHHEDTLVNALLHHCKDNLSAVGGTARPGIVHRIDKDTSGLLLVAKNDLFHRKIAALIKEHELKRDYIALVTGVPLSKSGLIDAPIGRDPSNRQRMSVIAGGKEARTHFMIREVLQDSCELSLSLETGRTHQIRVHMHFIGHPIIGDSLYGGRKAEPYLKGQALHAWRLSFVDPISGEKREFTASPPEDYLALRTFLETKKSQ